MVVVLSVCIWQGKAKQKHVDLVQFVFRSLQGVDSRRLFVLVRLCRTLAMLVTVDQNFQNLAT